MNHEPVEHVDSNIIDEHNIDQKVDDHKVDDKVDDKVDINVDNNKIDDVVIDDKKVDEDVIGDNKVDEKVIEDNADNDVKQDGSGEATVASDSRSSREDSGRFFKRRFLKKRVLVLLIFLALIWGNFFHSRPLQISSETAIYTEPLTSDGKFVDYIQAIKNEYPPQMKTDKNAARAIIKAIGTDAEMESTYKPDTLREMVLLREKKVNSIYQQLGLDRQKDVPKYLLKEAPNVFNGPMKKVEKKYPGPENIKKRKAEEDRFMFLYLRKRHVLFDEEYSRNWVNENMLALDAVVEAIENAEICAWPFLKGEINFWLADVSLPCAQKSRDYTRSLAFRSVWYLTQGEFDKALRDRIACQKLGTLSSKGALFIVEDYLGIHHRNIASEIPVFLAPDKRPSREIWQRLMDEPKISWDPDKCQKILELEGSFGLNLIALLEKFSSLNPDVQKEIRDCCSYALGDFFFNYYLKLGFDWNYIAKKYKEIYYQQVSSMDDFEEPPFLRAWYTGAVSPVKYYYEIARRSLTLRSRSDLMVQMMLCYTPAKSAWHAACQQMDCWGNLQKLGYAMQLYLCDHGTLPPAFTVDAGGKALHSWRVLLLPYFGKECAELYKKIRLTEPWDSEYNRQFHDQIPKIYCCQAMKKQSLKEDVQGLTNYTVILGPDSFFDTTGKGKDPLALHRSKPEKELMRKVLITERSDLICWMRPDDERLQEEAMIPYDIKRRRNDPPIRICESRHYGGFQAVLFDGSIKFIEFNIKEKDRAELFLGN